MPCYDGFYNSSLHQRLENARTCLIMQPVGLHVDMSWLMLTMLPSKRLANLSYAPEHTNGGFLVFHLLRSLCVGREQIKMV